MTKAGWFWAAATVVVGNLVLLVPVMRERSASARPVPMSVCADHLVGGYGESDRLRLALQIRTDGPLTGTDASALGALGFTSSDLELLGRIAQPDDAMPEPRLAWLRVEQTGGEGRSWAVTAVGAEPNAVAGVGLVLRGQIALGVEAIPDDTLRVIPRVHVLDPTGLYLDANQAAVLRPLRQTIGSCAVTRTAMLGNGPSGSVWVLSVR